MLIEEPPLAHYAKNRENIVTTDASNTGFGIPLWPRLFNGELKPWIFESKLPNRLIGFIGSRLGLRKIPIAPIWNKSLSAHRPPSN